MAHRRPGLERQRLAHWVAALGGVAVANGEVGVGSGSRGIAVQLLDQTEAIHVALALAPGVGQTHGGGGVVLTLHDGGVVELRARHHCARVVDLGANVDHVQLGHIRLGNRDADGLPLHRQRTLVVGHIVLRPVVEEVSPTFLGVRNRIEGHRVERLASRQVVHDGQRVLIDLVAGNVDAPGQVVALVVEPADLLDVTGNGPRVGGADRAIPGQRHENHRVADSKLHRGLTAAVNGLHGEPEAAADTGMSGPVVTGQGAGDPAGGIAALARHRARANLGAVWRRQGKPVRGNGELLGQVQGEGVTSTRGKTAGVPVGLHLDVVPQVNLVFGRDVAVRGGRDRDRRRSTMTIRPVGEHVTQILRLGRQRGQQCRCHTHHQGHQQTSPATPIVSRHHRAPPAAPPIVTLLQF